MYDRGGKEALERGGGGGHDDIFSQFFSGGGGPRRTRSGPQKGDPVHHKINVTLDNLYKGKTFKMAISRQRVKYPEGMTPQQAVVNCEKCGGAFRKKSNEGELTRARFSFLLQVKGKSCECSAWGQWCNRFSKRAPIAGGWGSPSKRASPPRRRRKHWRYCVMLERRCMLTKNPNNNQVRVEPGMKHGQKIVVSGEADETPGVEPGDVIFILNQSEHATFQRKGADLIMEKEISLRDALCGFSMAVKHLDERTLIIKSKEGEVIKPNTIKQIAGEGMPRYKRPFEKGRLFILFRVKFPDSLDLSGEKGKQLRKCLPADDALKDHIPPAGDNVEEITNPMVDAQVDDVGKVSYSAETGNAYDSDDEEDGGRRPQGVQCANQ